MMEGRDQIQIYIEGQSKTLRNREMD